MRSSLLKFAVNIWLLLFILNYSINAENCSQEKIGIKICNAPVAPMNELQRSEQDEKTLAFILLDQQKKEKTMEECEKVRDSELEKLYNYTKERKTSRSALLAKFMIGWINFTCGRGTEISESRKCFTEIVEEYPDTIEAELASKCCLKILDIMEEDYDPNIPCRVKEAYVEMEKLLPIIQEFDNDPNELTRAFRTRIVGDTDAKFEPVLRITMARFLTELGEEKKAIELYENIIEIYPDSSWAKDARISLKTIQGLKAEGRSIKGRLGIPRIKKKRFNSEKVACS
jgi:hypothetical protein